MTLDPMAAAQMEYFRIQKDIAVAQMTAAAKERRFNVACQMMAGMLANPNLGYDDVSWDNEFMSGEVTLVDVCYSLADKMLAKKEDKQA
jgi:hypothetical protein